MWPQDRKGPGASERPDAALVPAARAAIPARGRAKGLPFPSCSRAAGHGHDAHPPPRHELPRSCSQPSRAGRTAVYWPLAALGAR